MSSDAAPPIPLDDADPPRTESRSFASALWALLVRHQHLVLGVVLLALFMALRLAFLNADPPQALPNRARVYELFTDPPAKSYEARNKVLFGEWSTSPSDNYQFWRIQAPVWVYPISWFYSVFGVGYAQMRTFSTLCATAGLALFLVIASKRLRGFTYLLAGAFLTFNYYYILYARSGLLEALLNTNVLLTVLCLHLARKRLAWLLLAEWGLVLSFLTKQTGLFLLPLCLAAGGIAWWQHRKRGATMAQLLAPLVQAAVIAGGMAWYVFRDAYWRTVTWNYGHMLFNEDSTDKVDIKRFPVISAIIRIGYTSTWDTNYFGIFPIAGLFAWMGIARVAYLLVKRRKVDPWDLLMAGWMLSSWGILLLTPLNGVHYRLILFPPVAMMAARTVGLALEHPGFAHRKRLTFGIFSAVLAAEIGVHGTWYLQWALHRTYDMAAATELLREHVGNEGAVFCGMWSGPLIFNTKNKYYYIKAIFNADPEGISQLGLTHLLELEKADLAAARLWRTHREPMKSKQQILSFELRGHTNKLYVFTKPVQ
jgi:4-amino-4-deoxy-L-arabinose transferase-like glycosyltransferase